MARPEKIKKVEELGEKISKSKCCVLTDFRGLNVENMTDLRRKIRAAGGEYKVVKNTLSSIAGKNLGAKDLDKYLTGPTAIAFDYNDETGVAKVMVNFSKGSENLKIKCGILEGHKVIDTGMLKILADLPGKEVLIFQLASSLQGPLSKLANVLSANLQNLHSVINSLAEKKKAEQAA